MVDFCGRPIWIVNSVFAIHSRKVLMIDSRVRVRVRVSVSVSVRVRVRVRVSEEKRTRSDKKKQQ